MGNYIKINRKILDWEWYKNLNTCRLFFHLLLKANWKDGRFEGTEIPIGSFVSSIAKLAEETGLTQREVRTALEHLKATGELTVKSHNKYSVFTANNYSFYQDVDKQATSKRHSNDKLTTTIEEEKEIKEGNKNNIVEQIITHLNDVAGTKYRCQESTRRVIRARLSEGFTLNDFFAVIDKKVEEWKNTEMEKYIRPQTLFGTKFESYLNQPSEKPRQIKKNQFNSFPQRQISREEMRETEKMLLRKQQTQVDKEKMSDLDRFLRDE